MEIMTQKQYREYRQKLKDQGYTAIETRVLEPQQENEYGKAMQITHPELLTLPVPKKMFDIWK